MPDLKKHSFVLRRVAGSLPLYAPYEDSGLTTVVQLDAIVWDDFSQPDEITITIEPGDTLNTGGDSVLGVIEDLDG